MNILEKIYRKFMNLLFTIDNITNQFFVTGLMGIIIVGC